jgi:hypothetical protein
MQSLNIKKIHGTLQRYSTEISKHIFHKKVLRGHSPNSYIHVSVCDLNIPTISGLFQAISLICVVLQIDENQNKTGPIFYDGF